MVYICKQSFDAHKVGDVLKPYFDDANEIILDIKGSTTSHHIRKDGDFFKNHVEVK